MSFLLKSKHVQILFAFILGALILMLPRPEGTQFRISGDSSYGFYETIREHFNRVTPPDTAAENYIVEVQKSSDIGSYEKYLKTKIAEGQNGDIQFETVNGLTPKAMRFLAVLVVLIFLFLVEPIPLEITAILIGVSLVVMQIVDVKTAWAPYMHPVVVFIMCCLIFAISLEKAGLTKRLGHFIVKKAGTNVVRFTFLISIGLGLSSSFMHDAAAVSIGIVTMLPLMRAAGIQPHSNTAKFMLISLAFACSCGGMGTLIGGGRCMVSAAFLKEFTGIEINFFDWIKYAMPMALVTVPASVMVCYLVFRPDKTLELPKYDEALPPWSAKEKITLIIIGAAFVLWLTKGMHGLDYSVTGMLAVAALVLAGILKWDDVHENLEWGTALFIFGGGISLGLAMGYSGAADYFAHLFFPLIKGGGWLLLFAGVAVFGALVTNAMANVAAAALILPIVIPMAQLEGVDPRVLALCLGTATSFAMLLVIGCPPNAIAYSFRQFKASDITKVGLVATPVLLIMLIAVAAVWWKILGLV
ncbi:SLC13 family permease [Desulfatitalea tepidiphila]|uniref:SLC13 family permease n=1 Tax=Desulfatitalea tepidiphila TaxID=1185843 RepID=UPI0006B422F5|nr:DASS family sodium-coupled anion symporter [Desulfatitalea tepidiphila]